MPSTVAEEAQQERPVELPAEVTQCCEGTLQVDATYLNLVQAHAIRYGTSAHAQAYGRRNLVETVYSYLGGTYVASPAPTAASWATPTASSSWGCSWPASTATSSDHGAPLGLVVGLAGDDRGRGRRVCSRWTLTVKITAAGIQPSKKPEEDGHKDRNLANSVRSWLLDGASASATSSGTGRRW